MMLSPALGEPGLIPPSRVPARLTPGERLGEDVLADRHVLGVHLQHHERLAHDAVGVLHLGAALDHVQTGAVLTLQQRPVADLIVVGHVAAHLERDAVQGARGIEGSAGRIAGAAPVGRSVRAGRVVAVVGRAAAAPGLAGRRVGPGRVVTSVVAAAPRGEQHHRTDESPHHRDHRRTRPWVAHFPRGPCPQFSP